MTSGAFWRASAGAGACLGRGFAAARPDDSCPCLVKVSREPATGLPERCTLRRTARRRCLSIAIAGGFPAADMAAAPAAWSPSTGPADFRTAHWSKHPEDTATKRIALVYVHRKDPRGLSLSFRPPIDCLLADIVKAVDAAGPGPRSVWISSSTRKTEACQRRLPCRGPYAMQRRRWCSALSTNDLPHRPNDGKSFQAEYLEKANRSVGHL